MSGTAGGNAWQARETQDTPGWIKRYAFEIVKGGLKAIEPGFWDAETPKRVKCEKVRRQILEKR